MPTQQCQEVLNVIAELDKAEFLLAIALQHNVEKPIQTRDDIRTARFKVRSCKESLVAIAEGL